MYNKWFWDVVIKNKRLFVFYESFLFSPKILKNTSLSTKIFVFAKFGQFSYCNFRSIRKPIFENYDCLLKLCYCQKISNAYNVNLKKLKNFNGHNPQRMPKICLASLIYLFSITNTLRNVKRNFVNSLIHTNNWNSLKRYKMYVGLPKASFTNYKIWTKLKQTINTISKKVKNI